MLASTLRSNSSKTINVVSNKTRIIIVLFIAILIGTLGLSIVAFVTGHNFSGYATGMYSGLHQTYTQNDSIWGINCKRALTKGTFNKTIAVDGTAPTTLTIESSCDSGSLILNMKQDKKVESIDISNTNGAIPYSMISFDESSDIKLSVEHNAAKNVAFKISWE